MKRNFPDFLTAYQEYASDKYCPDQFHLWTGLSILAGAAQRKIWVRPAGIVMYPNLFVLLVSHAGVGKSTALERGVDLLEEIAFTTNPQFMIIPNQATEPGLIELMKIRAAIEIGKVTTYHSSGYFYASEASASALQNTCGSFTATITALYDCPAVFRKKLKGEKDTTVIVNSCFNVLAGSTFDYLKTLVDTQSVLGGFASRFVYVVCKDRLVREVEWDTKKVDKSKFRAELVQDLDQIHQLVGAMTPTEGFKELWMSYQPEFDRYIHSLNSTRLESLYARKPTNLLKTAMLLSLSESNSLELNEKHWEKARNYIEDVYKDTAYILSQAITSDLDSQVGLTQFILETVAAMGGNPSMVDVKGALLKHGNDLARVEATMNALRDARRIELTSDGSTTRVKLLVDPNVNL